MLRRPETDERFWRDETGGMVIESLVGPPKGRKGYERQLFPGVEVGLAGWERAHSQGNITGHESPHAILYAPAEVNQQFQRLGIEGFIRELREECDPQIQIVLTTVTHAHPGTLRLKEIQYKVAARWGSYSRVLFGCSIEVENKKLAPRVKVSAHERTPRAEWAALYNRG